MKVHNLKVTGSLTSGGETLTNISASVSTVVGTLTSNIGSIESKTGSYATTGSNLLKGDQTISGSIIPSVTNTYDLGDPTHNFRHLYLSSASLYIDGTKVLGSTTQELQITTDTGQSFKILEGGSDTITLQSADGNITLATSGGGDVILDPTTGVIALKGTTTLYAGNKILSSDGNAVHFGNSVTMTGSLIVTGFIETQELRTTYISSSVLYRSGSTKFGDELTDTHSFTGSLSVSGSISVPDSGLVSGSSQVDVMSTTNIARLATTGSNTFNGTLSVSTTTGDYAASITNVQDSSQGLLVRSTDNDSSLYLLNLQSSVGATSQTWVDRFSVTKQGYVGLSRTPEFMLDVNGDIALNRTNKLMFAGPVVGDRSRSYITGDGNNNLYVYGPSSNIVATFGYTGDFGVGTASPSGKFHVDHGDVYHMGILHTYVSTYVTSTKIGRPSTTSNVEIIYDIAGAEIAYLKRNYTTAQLRFDRGSTTDMIISGAGNVGINDTNPQTRLSINGANYIEMATFTTVNNSSIITANSGYVPSFTARYNSNTNVFTPTTNGIQILKAGMLYVTVAQDIRSAGTTGYSYLHIRKNGTTISENLITNTNTEWDMINANVAVDVAANDIINFYFSGDDILALDTGSWSQYVFLWSSR